MAPATINPITVKHGVIDHSFVQSGQGFSYFILMKDKAGDIKWKTKIFGRQYEKQLETDVQDIHLKTLRVAESNIIAVDEMGRTFEIDLDSGKLVKPVKPVDYTLSK